MTIKVEAVNTEIIKPSSPTLPQLRHFSLSLIDQLVSAVYVPVVLFFANADGDAALPPFEERSSRLKKSLSETLTRFYPLAGRPRDNSYIDCNDDGAEYVEARASCVLSDFLNEPTPEKLVHLLPIKTESPEAAADGRMLLVQATLFECGGMAIAISFSHKLVDASSVRVILRSWSAAARGSDTEEEAVEFLQASLLPPPEGIPIAVPSTDIGAKAKCVSRRLAFDGPKIAALKSAAASETVPKPTRVEAVVALIWKCAMKAANTTSSKPPSLSVMSETVSLRKRLTPPPPENSIGNLLGNFVAKPTPPGEKNLQGLVGLLRDGITEFNEKNIKNYQGKDSFMKIMQALQKSGGLKPREDVAVYISSSWSRFGSYAMDFGWGKPTWVSIASITFLNFILLTDTKDGEGIEAWVTLKEEEMASFEQDDELLAFASVNPSIAS